MAETVSLVHQAFQADEPEFKDIKKNCQVSFNKVFFKYADLAAIMSAVQSALKEQGICIVQTMSDGEDNKIKLTTRLIHISGQTIESYFSFTVPSDPKQLGSQFTYFRRYQLSAILALCADEDKDAVALTPNKSTPASMISDPQRKRLFAIMNKQEISEIVFKDYLFKNYKIESSSKILKKDYETIVSFIEGK